jgi:hypothetical protein
VARCGHGRDICSECIVVDDAAKRAHDIVRGLAVFTDYDTRIRSFVAIRLSDGGSDQVLYGSKQDAVRHQLSEQQCAYFSFRGCPNGFASARDAAIFLAWHRMAYDNGFRLPDPDDAHGGPDLAIPSSMEHVQNQLNRLRN